MQTKTLHHYLAHTALFQSPASHDFIMSFVRSLFGMNHDLTSFLPKINRPTTFTSRRDQIAGSSVGSSIVIALNDNSAHDAGVQITNILSKKRTLEIEDSDSEEDVNSTCSTAKRACRGWKQEPKLSSASEYHSLKKEERIIKGEFNNSKNPLIKNDTAVKEEHILKSKPVFKKEDFMGDTTTSSRAASGSPQDTASRAEFPNSNTTSFATPPSPVAPPIGIASDVASARLARLARIERRVHIEELKREIEERDVAIEIYFAEIDKLTMERIGMYWAVKEMERTAENDFEILQSLR